jgi:hypothetical protein
VFDITLKFIADKLGKSLENVAPHVEQELQDAVENLANAAYSSIISKIQSMSMDPNNRKDYLRALKFQNLGEGTWLIFLDGDWATKLEEGFGPYSIKDQLLKSQKIVQVGRRAGEPWVRTTKKGKRIAAVPFSHKPFSGEKASGDLKTDIKKILVKNRAGQTQSITKIFKDLEGKPLSGKVAVGGKVEGAPNLSNLTKYQFVSNAGKVSSVYMTYRMVSDDSSGWMSPGFPGYNLFKEAEEYVVRELENILKTLL